MSFCLAFAVNAVAQSGNGRVIGIVEIDGIATAGAEVVLTNMDTESIARTITNGSGVYSFAGVPPGNYSLSAAAAGFRTFVYDDVRIGISGQVRLNFSLLPGGLTEFGEASVKDLASPEISVSAGNTIPGDRIRDLPAIGMDSLELLRIVPGILGANFAGVDPMRVNTARDGLSLSHSWLGVGPYGTTVLNPELIGEIRMVLSPADAELGRGNVQVQVATRSAAGRYAGSAVWNVRNSGLDANTWNNNRAVADGVWSPVRPDWENNQSLTLRYGGPIVRDKTFFHVLYEQQRNDRRELVTASVMTDTARQGIFRYFPGWSNGNAATPVPASGSAPQLYPVVDLSGNPAAPASWPDGTAYTGLLHCFSVLGNEKVDGTPFTQADCPDGVAVFPLTTDGSFDPTGYIAKVLERMPRANYFAAGDGLNTAGFQWVRRRSGSGGLDFAAGAAQDSNRRQINVRIDHRISQGHRLSANWSHERSDTEDGLPNWPDGLSYRQQNRPHVLTVQLTSILTPFLVNEARFGMRYSSAEMKAPWEIPETQREAENFFVISNNWGRALVSPGAGSYAFGGTLNGVMSTEATPYVENRSRLYTYANTLNWSAGRHAFKFGGEARLARSNFNDAPCMGCPLARVMGGFNSSNQHVFAPSVMAGFVGANRSDAVNMLYFLGGGVANANMIFWASNENNVTGDGWIHVGLEEKMFRNLVENEYAAFIKDDWKLTRSLTLNLGARWEYYAPPYIQGLTSTAVGLGAGLFGVGHPDSGDPFDGWLQPGNVFLTGYGPILSSEILQCELPGCDPAKLTRVEFVGPGTSQPEKTVMPPDRNNWGPAIGVTWQVPWDAGMTVRGGYQVTYGSGRMGAFSNVNRATQLVNAPHTSVWMFQTAPASLNLLSRILPVEPLTRARMGDPLSVAGTGFRVYAFAPDYVTPYTQNFNLSITRRMNRWVTADIRYIGTVSKKQQGVLNINAANVYGNPELWEALDRTRRGDDVLMFDQMFAGLNLAGSSFDGYAPVGTIGGGVLQSGSAHLRRHSGFTRNLANGDFYAVATLLATLNSVENPAELQRLSSLRSSYVGSRVLRNGCDRMAAGFTTVSELNTAPLRCFPENYIRTNPQLSEPYYIANLASSNYHSMQAQVTLEPEYGFHFQATYTWSKSLGIPGGTASYTDPRNPEGDYAPTASNRKHDFRAHGGIELPLGPGKALFGNSSGWVARLAERWQMNAIFRASSGAYASVQASPMLFANGRADIVAPVDLAGKVRWDGDTGSYFDGSLTTVRDPQCAIADNADAMGFFLGSACSLGAIADAETGQILLQHPIPGNRGTLGSRTIELAGLRNFDANLQKTFQIGENKTLSIRMDATNVLNTPVPNAPDLNISSGNFGQISGKGDQRRRYRGQIRVEF